MDGYAFYHLIKSNVAQYKLDLLDNGLTTHHFVRPVIRVIRVILSKQENQTLLNTLNTCARIRFSSKVTLAYLINRKGDTIIRGKSRKICLRAEKLCTTSYARKTAATRMHSEHGRDSNSTTLN